jgi:hypothetical protein
MAKTTILIDDDNEILLKNENKKTSLSKKDLVNYAIRNTFTDITNKELLEEIKKIK